MSWQLGLGLGLGLGVGLGLVPNVLATRARARAGVGDRARASPQCLGNTAWHGSIDSRSVTLLFQHNFS